jgi:Zn-dependent protease/predicted transcriptional regulator
MSPDSDGRGEQAEGGARPRERRGSGWSFRIGTLLGVPIRVHVTFLFLLVWFGAVSSQSGRGYLGGVVFLLLLFGCVVLHELGHATMARRYGVKTSEIVLYPIGGIARLDRIPSGKAELLIAIAGPLVNLVLAALIWAGLQFAPVSGPESAEEMVGGPLAWQLLTANLSLFVFNLIPAFPMDGGRILRAGLSLAIGQQRATTIAARVGQGLAILFALFAVFPGPVKPMLLLIALFVFLGAGQEEAYQRGRAAVRGLVARDAMVTQFATLAPQDSLGHAAELLLATHQHDFPVVDLWGRVAGLLPRATLIAALAEHGREVAVLEVMERELVAVRPETSLDDVLGGLQSRPGATVLVVGEKGLEGMITLENLGELIEVSRSLQHLAK